MRVLIIDNYDSFTFNLYQVLGEVLNEKKTDFELDVIKNDQFALDQIEAKNYQKILISPGPGNPSEKKYFGVCDEVITILGKKVSVLGVCLGLQGICHYFGGKIIKADYPMHGKTSTLSHTGTDIFTGLPQNLEVMRYHSLIADPDNIPECLEITATVKSKHNSRLEIMGIKHKYFPISGVQFHPESFASEAGKELLNNWLKV